MKRIAGALLALAWGLVLIPLRAQAAPILVQPGDFTGSRSTPPASGIYAADGWTDNQGGFRIAWEISFDGNVWKYKYTFTDKDGGAINPDMSHVIFEVSDSITPDNVNQLIFNTNFTLEGPRTWAADPLSPNNTSPGGNNGNPNLPADIYGIKADTGSDEVGGMYMFESLRRPIWGDFYTKDGKHGGIVAVAWNTGIGTDPDANTTDFTPWIPVPDTLIEKVPLPASLLLLLAGVAALFLARRN